MGTEVQALDSDQSPIVGIALTASVAVDEVTNGKIHIGEESIDVPLRFYKGSLNSIRTELHGLVDELIDTLSA